MENNSLSHHGTKGMRWGIRRFQNKDGSLTPLGKRKRRSEEKLEAEKSKNKEKLAAEKAKNNLTIEKLKFKGQMAAEKLRLKGKLSSGKEKAKADEEEANKHDQKKMQEDAAEKRDRIIREGTADEVLSIKGQLTQQEMQQVYNRIQWENNINKLKSEQVSAGKQRADKVFNTIGDVTEYTVKGAKAWNMFANVYNSLNGDGKVLPKIQTNIADGNKKEVDSYKKRKQEAADKTAKEQAERDAKKESDKAEKKAAKESKKAEKQSAKEEAKKEKKVEREYVTLNDGDEIIDGPSRSSKKSQSDGWTRTDYKRSTDRGTSFVHDNPSLLSSPVSSYTSGPSKQTLSLGQSYVSGLLGAPKDRDDD